MGVAEDVLADPGRRQVGQHFLGFGQVVEAAAGVGAVEQAGVGVDHAFRVAGGARGEEHRRHVLRRAGLDLAVEEAGVGGVARRSGFDQRVQRFETGLGVIAQAA